MSEDQVADHRGDGGSGPDGTGQVDPKLPKRERTRARLIAAARRTFARHGYLNTKITDITVEAGVANGLFYRYFTDKNELLRELTGEFKAQLPHVLSTKWKPEPHPLVGMGLSTEIFIRDYLKHNADVAGIFQAAMVDQSFAELWREVRSHGIRLAADYTRKAQKLGFALHLDPELTASALASMIELSCYNWISFRIDFPNRAVREPELIDTLVTMVVACLRGGRECAEADDYLDELRGRLYQSPDGRGSPAHGDR